MKPILLTISGLHSFRKKQSIDFTLVNDTGIFGIFGPTGSGKSTILDAITLALFGRVERSDSNRVGIINQQENEIYVKFVFELSSAKTTEKYYVERVYQRSDELRVRSKLARLVYVEQEKELVLADKETEVSNKVEALLGLTVDDFTRAVVLPQGKFAEFLTLKSNQRRPMLERLFQLDKFGKNLKDKVQAKENALKKKRDEIHTKLEMLTDATKENLEAAEKELFETKRQKEELEKIYEQYLINYKSMEKVWELQQKQKEIIANLDKLLLQEQYIQSLSAKKEKAEKALVIFPIIENLKGLEGKIQTGSNEVEKLTSERNNILETVNIKKESFSKYDSLSKEQIPNLTERKYKLQDALNLEIEIQQMNQVYANFLEKLESLKPEIKEKEELNKVFLDQVEKMTTEMKEIKSEIEKIEISTEQRQRIELGSQLYQSLSQIEKENNNIQLKLDQTNISLNKIQDKINTQISRRENITSEIETLEQALRELLHEEPLSEEEWHQQERRLFELEMKTNNLLEQKNTIDSLKRELDSIEHNINEVNLNLQEKESSIVSEEEKKLHKKERILELEQIKNDSIAAVLATHLVEGEPCKVCGSIHHPAPTRVEGNPQAINEEIAVLNQELEEIENRLTSERIEYKAFKENLKLLFQQKDRLEKEHNTKADVYHEGLRQIPEEYSKDIYRAFPVIKEDQKAHKELKNAIDQWFDEKNNLESLLSTKKEELTGVLNSIEIEESQLKVITPQRIELIEVVEKLGIEREELEAEWKDKMGFIPFKEFESYREEMKEKDRQREVLQKKQKELEHDLVYMQEKEKATNEELRSLNTKKYDIDADIKRVIENRNKLEEKINLITEGSTASHLIAEVEKQINEINNKLDTSKQEMEESTSTLNKVEQKLHSHQAILANLEEQVSATLNQLEQSLHNQQFKSIEEVEECHLTVAEMKLITKEIEDYKQQKAILTEQSKEYEKVMNGNEISKEKWEEETTHKKRLEDDMLILRDSISTLGYKYEKLQLDHKQWNQLEKERKALQNELDTVSELNQVLRGNAFVDFIAHEYLYNISIIASEKLKQLTRNRYSLQVDFDGSFKMIDELNGGLSRPVQSLSGGETFLTSLALALALSSQIQLKGERNLEFFFLDEGFGSLDSELLDTVMMALEKLNAGQMTIGIITHVPELQSRIYRKVLITPPDSIGSGSKIKIEYS